MKIIVAGGRTFDFDNRQIIFDKLDEYKNQKVTIVSGGARGVDAIGELWAEYNSKEVIRIMAEWKIHGRAAGPIRNRQMAEIGDMLIAFWDGKSKGTKNMIEEAKKQNLKIEIVEV